MRPSTSTPRPVPSHSRGLARPRYQDRRVTSEGLLLRNPVTIDVHGSLDRAKDVSSFAAPVLDTALREECVRMAHADDVPLLVLPEDTRCHRCVRLPGTSPVQTLRTDRDVRSTDDPRRLPASCTPGCLPPLRPEHEARVGSPLTPPTRSPHGWGQCALEGIASAATGITRQGHSGSRTPLRPRDDGSCEPPAWD
jgi:hypothetical protein